MERMSLTYLRNAKFYIFCIFVLLAPISKGVLEVAFALILFLWIAENALVKKWKIWKYFPETKLNLPIAVLIAVLFLSVFNSVAFHLSLRKFFSKWVQLMMIYFFTVDILDSKKKLKTVLWLLSATLTLVLIDGLWQCFPGKDFLYSNLLDGGRWITGCYAGLSAFGSVIILVAPVIISFLFAFHGKLIMWYRALLIGLAFICLLLSCSITSWTALIASIGFCVFLSRKKSKKVLLFFLLLSIGVAMVLFSPVFKDRILTALDGTFNGKTGRIAIWKENIEEIKNNPILGKGINTTTVELAEKYSELPLVIKANPHSLYLLILLEAGILGLLAYLWIILRVFFMLIKLNKNVLGLGFCIGIMSFLIINIASTIWYERIQSLFWLILGLMVVYSKMQMNSLLKNKENN